MKYGTDPLTVDTVTTELLNHIGQQRQTHWYMWIDMAFDVADERNHVPEPAGLNIYQVDNMRDLAHMAPHILMAYRPGDDQSTVKQRLLPWLTHASGRPMFSLWASDHTESDLAKHMRHWSWAQTPEQQTVLLRLADTRSVCSLHAHLRPAQWQALTRQLRSWLYIDRQGAVKHLPVGMQTPPADNAPALPESMVFDEAQLQAMATTAEPDAMLHYVCTHMPDQLPQGSLPSKMHAYTAWVLATAEEKGIQPWTDKLTLLLAACHTRGAVMKDPRFEKIFEHANYTPGQLHQTLREKGLI